MSETAGTIFINYRKDDSRWNSLALYNELQKYFDKEQLFKDFNTILPGSDFVLSIQSALEKCDILLVIIGADWLNIIDETGKRRLDDPDDFVRLEVSTALSRNIQVIPVLMDNTPMPKASELPEDMRNLYRRQFVEIDNTRFEDDVRNLAEAIKKILPQEKENKNKEDDQQRQHFRHDETDKKQPLLPRPSNNMVMAILAVIFCFPVGIVSILSANKVDNLWASGQHQQAINESKKARTWAIYAFVTIIIVYLIYFMSISANTF